MEKYPQIRNANEYEEVSLKDTSSMYLSVMCEESLVNAEWVSKSKIFNSSKEGNDNNEK